MRPIDADALREIWVCQPRHDFEPSSFVCSIDNAPTVEPSSPWHMVEDGLPKMSAIVPGYVCSDILVLCDAESGYMDIGYVREKPDNNGVDWLWGKPLKSPTHWMPIEPPKEDNDG